MIKAVMGNLEKNNMRCFFAETKEEALAKILDLVPENSTIGFGGSKTLEQVGVFAALEKKKCKILDWKRADSKEENMEIRKHSLLVDVYLCSSNAITRDGKLVNIDGTGNRVSAITFGPGKVIIVAGKNKIVENEEGGVERIRNVAAPVNAKHLGRKTPCVITGKCMDCASKDRICCTKVVHSWQKTPGRINVILVDKDLGY